MKTPVYEVVQQVLADYFYEDDPKDRLVTPAMVDALALSITNELRKEYDKQGQFTTVEYEASEFNGPAHLRINGQHIAACKKLTVTHEEGEFNEVAVVLPGCLVTVRGRE